MKITVVASWAYIFVILEVIKFVRARM